VRISQAVRSAWSLLLFYAWYSGRLHLFSWAASRDCKLSSGPRLSYCARNFKSKETKSENASVWAVTVLETVRRRSFRRKWSFHVPCSRVIDTDVESCCERGGWLSFRGRMFGLSAPPSVCVRVVVGRPVSTTVGRVGREVSAKCRCVTIFSWQRQQGLLRCVVRNVSTSRYHVGSLDL